MARKVFCDICNECVNHWYKACEIVGERGDYNE